MGNTAEQMTGNWRSALLPLLLMLVFACSQSLSLLHSHEGDLQLSYDCQLCLHAGSAGDAPAVTLIMDPASAEPGAADPDCSAEFPALPYRLATARAPPLSLLS